MRQRKKDRKNVIQRRKKPTGSHRNRHKHRETLVKRMIYKIREEMRESKRESGMSTLKVFC